MKPSEVANGIHAVAVFHDSDAVVEFDHEFGIRISTQKEPTEQVRKGLESAGLRYNSVLRQFFFDGLRDPRRR